MEVQSWPIDRITVRERIRQDLGDLSTLKQSMTERGLINPVTAKRDGTLLAGERRFCAAQELGWAEIEVRVWGPTDSLEDLDIEAEENLCRKDLTLGEAELFQRRRKKLLRPEAEAAQKSGKPSVKLTEGSKRDRETAVRAAKGTGFTHNTLKKVEEVRTAAEDETQPKEVRKEAQVQHDLLMKGKTKATTAQKAVEEKRRWVRRTPEFATGLLPGQKIEVPAPARPQLMLSERLVNGIGKGQGLEALAAEIQDSDLDLGIDTIIALRSRLKAEIKERRQLDAALKSVLDKRKVTA